MQDISLEVGPRTLPLMDHLRKDLLSSGRMVYLEKRRTWTKDLKGLVEGVVIHGDGSRLPFEDGSVGTIFAKDLFGAHGQLAYLPQEGLYIEMVSEAIAPEWFRVLRRKGKVVIVEVATPVERGKLEQDFGNSGFTKKHEYLGKDTYKVLDGWESMTLSTSALPEEAYSVVFEKP
jgi:SAM-dependent methyltransferase